MQIRLYDKTVVIKIPKNSKYVSFVHSRIKKFQNSVWIDENKIILPHNSNESQKIRLFLTSIYYLCAYMARYENPIFYGKLINSYYKKIIVNIESDNHCELSKYRKMLDIKNDADAQTIRKRYLQLAKIYHPDKVANQNPQIAKEYNEKFMQIKEAYEMLKSSIAA